MELGTQTKPLKSSEIADICHVSHRAVLKWVEAGKIKAVRTPGNHTRINVDDFLNFLNEYKMPVPTEFQRQTGAKKRILIVDDDKMTVKTIRNIFEKNGDFEIKEAYDGFSAGLLYSEFRPQLITLDIMMPMVNGFEACSIIRKDAKDMNVRIIAVSGVTDDKLQKRILRCGADDFLLKPFTAESLLAKSFALLAK